MLALLLVLTVLPRVVALSPLCLQELFDIAGTASSNFSLWNESRRVANPEWDGRVAVEPSFIAFPRSVDDVRRCLECATRHDVRVAVKGGGHSFGGYSTLPASQGFMINLRFMSAAFEVVEQGPGRPATVTVQAGARWRDVYQSFKRSGKEWVVTGGLCPSVGVAGFTMGGGVGPAARLHGLAIDSVLSFTMVTASGVDVVTANSISNPDLFWALRGGGGGNFGVVTDLTFQVHPGPALYSFGQVCFPWSQTPRLLAVMQELGPSLPRTVNADIVVDKDPANSGACLWVTAIETLAVTRDKLAPLLSALPVKPQKDTLRENNCWWEGISDFANEHGYSEYDDDPYYSKNCLIDSITPALAAVLVNLTDGAPAACGGQHFIAFGGKVSEQLPVATAFPWRASEYMVYSSCSYTHGDDASRTEAQAFMQRWENEVFPHSNGGSYVNFIDPLAKENGAHRYYGQNLKKLGEIKRRWNPGSNSPLHFPMEIPVTDGTLAV